MKKLAALFLLALLLASCETPSEGREDRQIHEREMERMETQRAVELARLESEARIAAEEARIAAAQQETARLEEMNRHREERFMLWTTALAAFTGHRNPWTNYIVPAILGLVCGAGFILWWERKQL